MIIGISGKKQSGKDEVAKMIQYLTSGHGKNGTRTYLESKNKISKNGYGYAGFGKYNSDFEVVKFADKLKDIVCLLIGCTREELEGEEFKNKELGEEWINYRYATGFTTDNNNNKSMLSIQCSKEKYEQECITNWQTAYKTAYTPRMLLQYIGTNLFREQLLPNIWVNATMADYISNNNSPFNSIKIYPQWIISDVRFPNEFAAIKEKNGINIRVERPSILKEDLHESETALDNREDWDYIIQNDGTINELLEKVKDILVNERILE